MKTAAICIVLAFTLFLSSFLLFLCQPIQGKMLLPYLGGTPAVWSVCMFFFQTVLLLGYLYAHLLSSRLSIKAQLLVHVPVLILPFVALPQLLPPILTSSPLLQQQPVTWTVWALISSIGPAFFAISTSSPLIQSWLSRTDLPLASNPYPLFAAGNAGSLLALLCYPLLIESHFSLTSQTQVWTMGYGILVVLTMGFGALFRQRQMAPSRDSADSESPPVQREEWDPDMAFDIESWTRRYGGKKHLGQYLHWTLLAAIPSSLMLGVTTFLTTDIATIPMLWVLPLGLYTLSFVMVFSRYSRNMDQICRWLLPPVIGLSLYFLFTEKRDDLWLIISTHLTGFFLVSVCCHGRLAMTKPPAEQLTKFYFFVALGGVAGGLFNALVAPLVFVRVVEYPFVLALSLLLSHPVLGRSNPKPFAVTGAAAAFALGIAVMLLARWLHGNGVLYEWTDQIGEIGTLSEEQILQFMFYAVPMVIGVGFLIRRKPEYWAASLAGTCLIATIYDDSSTQVIHRSRSFFGLLTVQKYDTRNIHSLVHGGIMHGEQHMMNELERSLPRSYYHRDGPLGQVIGVIEELVDQPHFGVIGLGSGSIAAYGHPENRITFYELNPHVVNLALDTNLFTYVDDCVKRGCNLDIVIGDGRLKVAEERDPFDLLVVDAFSSDAIPIHLLTKEALELYFSKMTSSGILAFHISNHYVDLEPVILNLALDLGLGYAALTDDDDAATGRSSSSWVILAAEEGLFSPVVDGDERWTGLGEDEKVGIWRDDYANVARVLKWF